MNFITDTNSNEILHLKDASASIKSLLDGESIMIYADVLILSENGESRIIQIKDGKYTLTLRNAKIKHCYSYHVNQYSIPCNCIKIIKSNIFYYISPIFYELDKISVFNKLNNCKVLFPEKTYKINVDNSQIEKKQETLISQKYIFELSEIIEYYNNSPDFRKLVLSGNYIYIDKLIVPYIPAYFDYQNNKFVLNKLIKEHYTKTCVCIFTTLKESYKILGKSNFKSQINIKKKVKTPSVGTENFGEKAFTDFINSLPPSQTNETFGKALKRFMKAQGFSISLLAESINVDTRTIDRYLADQTLPALSRVIAIYVAMKLFPTHSYYLIFKAGYCLNDNNSLYIGCITFLAPLGLATCNQILIESGYNALA